MQRLRRIRDVVTEPADVKRGVLLGKLASCLNRCWSRHVRNVTFSRSYTSIVVYGSMPVDVELASAALAGSDLLQPFVFVVERLNELDARAGNRLQERDLFEMPFVAGVFRHLDERFAGGAVRIRRDGPRADPVDLLPDESRHVSRQRVDRRAR